MDDDVPLTLLVIAFMLVVIFSLLLLNGFVTVP